MKIYKSINRKTVCHRATCATNKKRVKLTHHGKKNTTPDKSIEKVKSIKPIQSIIIEDMFPGPIVLILDKKYLAEVKLQSLCEPNRE